MLGHNFNHGIIRKFVITFGSLFTDIYVNRLDADNKVVTNMLVPISYGPKEKFLARLLNDPTLSRPVAMVLPRIAFQIVDIKYNNENKLPTITKNISGTSYVYNPVAYDFHFELYVMVKNQEDGTRIIEQILPFFTPDWTTSINLIPEMDIYKDIPIILNSISQQDTYEGDFQQRRAIIWTLGFTLKGQLFGPIHASGNNIIKKVIVDFYTPVDEYFTFGGQGTITSNTSVNVLYGTGTDFSGQKIGVGGKIYHANGAFIGSVNSISNSTYLVLTSNSEINFNQEKFRFTPNTIINAAKVETVVVYPGLTANGQPTTNSSLSINYNQINENDNYGYIVDFISNE